MTDGILALLGLVGGDVLLIAIAFLIGVMGLAGLLKRPRSFNPYLLTFVAAGVAIAILTLWTLPRLSWFSSGGDVLSLAVQATVSILEWPMKFYVVDFLGARDPWLIPSLNLLLVNGLIWGVVIERAALVFPLRKPVP